MGGSGDPSVNCSLIGRMRVMKIFNTGAEAHSDINSLAFVFFAKKKGGMEGSKRERERVNV